MKILSLFDGMSCAQLALNRAGIKYDTYYASEIDKHAITVTMANFPNTIQLGSVVNVNGYELPEIDILMGGSPCQSFSFAGKRKGMSTKCETEILTLDHYLQLKSDGFEFEGQSYLFWEYMRILNELRVKNPSVKFLLENVEMGDKWEKILSKAIGVNGIHINSALVSAQNRKRIYWTNIGLEPGGLFGDMQSIIQQPKDKGILLKHILESDVDEKYYLSDKMVSCLINRKKTDTYTPCSFEPIEVPFDVKSRSINQRIAKMGDADNYIKVDKKGNIKDNQDKASCFTAGGNSGGNHSDMDLIVHNLMPRSSKTGKGGTGPLSREDGKTYCLDTGNTNAVELKAIMLGRSEQYGNPEKPGAKSVTLCANEPHGIHKNSRIRRLTPLECERLQTVPEGYTNYVSDTQRYRMLGNGWTIDVIAHILTYFKNKCK